MTTHASICSGIDGPALAASWLGWENLFHADISEFTNKILKFYYPDARQYTDIRKADFSVWRGKIDVLTAGFPCQPFSVAGQRTGEDHDSYLWPETLRVVNEVRPRWFIGENVNGIVSMVFPGEEINVGGQTDIFGEEDTLFERTDRYILDRICCDLEAIGYETVPVVIPACAVGAPHERMRCFFLSHDNQDERFAGIDLEEVYRAITYSASNGNSGKPEEFRESQRGQVEGMFPEPIDSNHVRRLGANRAAQHAESGFDAENSLRYGRDYIERKEEPEIGRQRDVSSGDNERVCGVEGADASDPERLGGQKIHENIQPRQPNGARANGIGGKWDAPNADCFDGDGAGFCTGGIPQLQASEIFGHIPNWDNFPTQSPVCSGNDELSRRLSGITFSRWRTESITALGNAIAPLQILPILRFIEMIDNYDFGR